ncbi:MAG: DMT family transporter [Pseudomonadota bacterium]
MDSQSSHVKGLIIVTFGVLIVTPDTLLIRLIGLDPWSLLVWRGLLQALGLTAILLIYFKGYTLGAFRAIGRKGIGAAVIFSLSSFFFLYALDQTSVANVLILLATAPFFAALFAWFLLGEPVPLRTWLAILATLVGVALLGVGSFGAGTWIGDLAALGGAATLGLKFVVIRGARRVNMIPAMAISGLMIAAAASLVAPMPPVGPTQLGYILIMGLLVIPLGIALLTLGPRYLPAPEVSLLLLLETVLGPLWVWLALDEVPTVYAMAGGAVVIAALALHSVYALRAARP